MLDTISTFAGSGALIRIYSGAQPGGGSAPTGTLLGELTISGAFASAASSGVLTWNAVTSDTATATGQAAWFRLTKSDSTWVMDGDITTIQNSTGDMLLDDISIALNGTIALSGPNTTTAPNAA